jgi:transposase
VIDHASGRLVWAEQGRDKQTVARFCAALGQERAERVELVSSDMGAWQLEVISKKLPQATVCLDPFHVVQLASDAVDEVRREVWNELRRGGQRELAAWHRGVRWALRKRPEHLSERQRQSLAAIQHTNRRLWRAYLLKEQLRAVFALDDPAAAIRLLDAWLAWAQRSRIPAFVKLARTIRAHRPGIVATLTHRLTNARAEALNTTLRLITRRAYGFHSAKPLIALAFLTLGGLRPALPGRRA